jgi:hypothetical protein
MALGAILKEDAEMIARLPTFLASPRWAYMPAILFTVGSIVLTVRTLAPLVVKPASSPALVAAPLTQGPLSDPGSPAPSYVGSIRYLGGAVGDGGAVRLEFKVNNYLDRLRVYVEFSTSENHVLYPAVWGQKHKIQIADLRDVAKGQIRIVPLVYESHNAGQKSAFWWGDPEVQLKDASPLLERAKNKARVLFVGPDNKEQVYKLIAIRSIHDHPIIDMSGSPVVGILDESEIKSALDWPEG